MKERPILFSGDMVRAILDGRKTQTRRPYTGIPPTFYPSASGGRWGLPIGQKQKAPFGTVGDRLWVRETWAPHADIPRCAIYRCDRGGDYQDTVTDDFRWRPSIHMPRWASRITLEVTRVWVERVQDITEEGAKAEGIVEGGCLSCGEPEPCRCAAPKPNRRDSFAGLWQSIYGTWAANPWVWAVEFRRVKP